MGTHPIFESDFDCLTEETGQDACRIVSLFRPQDLPRPRYVLHPQRWQTNPSPVIKDGRPVPRQEEPAQVTLDSSLPSQAQEATEARDSPKTTRQCDQGGKGEEEGS